MKQAAAALSRLDLDDLRYALEVIAGVRLRDKVNESPMAGCFLSFIQAAIFEEAKRRWREVNNGDRDSSPIE